MVLRSIVALFLCVFSLFPQGTTSRLQGVVVDSSGSVIAGATVTLSNEGTNVVFETKTTGAGTYVFESVQSGRYTVMVESTGFKKFTAKGNAVSIGQPTTVNVTLQVGAVTETVEVSGAYQAVQTSTSGNMGNLLEEKIIKDLPIVGTRGRNPLDLVLIQPGITSGSNTGGGIHVHGARDRAWNYTLDGIDTNETSAGGSNFSPIRANPDSLAEFRVITGNFTADSGRNSGAQVAMVTKSGTNDLHGSGFWFYRTPRLNANEWENNLDNLGKRQFVQNIFGGSIGGPVKKNQTFFFANVQALRALETAQVTRTVYTQSMRQGIYRYNRGGRNLPAGVAGGSVDAAGNPLVNIGSYNIFQNDPQRIGADRGIAALIAATPLPNRFDFGDGLNTAGFTFVAPQNERQHDVTFKVDGPPATLPSTGEPIPRPPSRTNSSSASTSLSSSLTSRWLRSPILRSPRRSTSSPTTRSATIAASAPLSSSTTSPGSRANTRSSSASTSACNARTTTAAPSAASTPTPA
ncbi:MAG: hypothetical protein B7X34_05925 [Acidobacteriia bacterium 12-62-4]|nr:MAG: hypothetical protein B7X34_05925 [Acidobacteriia bacterium 12-62-4]